MIFRQMFDSVSGTYTYLLASRPGGEALIIDPVIEKVDRYLQLVAELDLKLVKAVDTHLHADHITRLGALPNPKMMDVAVPANMKVGLAQDEIARRGWAVGARDALELLGRGDIAFIDLRETAERERHGVIPGSVHAPYPALAAHIAPGGLL